MSFVGVAFPWLVAMAAGRNVSPARGFEVVHQLSTSHWLSTQITRNCLRAPVQQGYRGATTIPMGLSKKIIVNCFSEIWTLILRHFEFFLENQTKYWKPSSKVLKLGLCNSEETPPRIFFGLIQRDSYLLDCWSIVSIIIHYFNFNQLHQLFSNFKNWPKKHQIQQNPISNY